MAETLDTTVNCEKVKTVSISVAQAEAEENDE